MKTKTIVGAGAALCLVSGFAATEFFSGTGSWMDPTAWDAGQLPDPANTVQVGGGAQLTFDTASTVTQSVARLELGYEKNAAALALLNLQGGVLQPGYFFMGTATNAPSMVIQTGGMLKTSVRADPEFSIGYNAGSTNLYELSGGEINLAGTGHVGTYGNGTLIQNGGHVTCPVWFVPGRWDGATGLYQMTAGTADFTGYGLIVGEFGEATMTVSGTGDVAVKRLSVNGKSKLEIGTGGKVAIDYAIKQNTTTGNNGQILIDGGTFAARPSAQNDPFITGVDHLYVGDNGANIYIPEGVRAAFRVPFAAAPGATTGDLVKQGTGLAHLFNEQSFKGKAVVEGGYLSLLGTNPLPSYGADKLSVSPGASVIIDGTIEDAKYNQALANVAASTDAGFGIDTMGYDMAKADDIVLNGNAEFSKMGVGILSLTGENAWGGFTRIWSGTLDAKRGEGLPANSAIRYSGSGGAWAPREDVTLTVGTGAGQISTDDNAGAFGFATIAEDVKVTIGDAGTAVVPGVENLKTSGLILDAAADTALTFENPITLANGNLTVNTPGAGQAVIAGDFAPEGGNRYIYKTGAGALSFDGSVADSRGGATRFYVCPQAGVTSFNGPDNAVCDIIQSGNSTVYLTNNAALYCYGWYYAGQSGTGSRTVQANGDLDIHSGCYLQVGYNVGSVGAYDFSGGTITAPNFAVGGSKGRGTFTQSGGELSGGAGYVGQYTAPGNGEARSGESVYNISGGTANFTGNFQVGVYSNGRLEQSGGAITETTGWTSLGRQAGASGVINMTGGTYDSKTYGVIVGEIGNGTVNISGDAVMTVNNFYVSGNSTTYAYNANGSVSVTDGGRLNANVFIQGWSTNSASFYVNGGTLGVCAETGVVYDWFRNLAGALDVGPAGATFDTGAVDVYTDGLGLGGATTGTIVKKGSGSLNLSALPEAAKVQVQEGTLGLRGSAKTSQLVHRWSFNGTLEDSVGENDGAVYTPKGSVTASGGTAPALSAAAPVYTDDGKSVSLAGGAGKDMIGLGANILPATGPVTVEIWTTLRAHSTWVKMFSVGVNQANGILFTFCDGASSNFTSANFLQGGTGNATGTGNFIDNNPYYYAYRFTPLAEGGTLLSAFAVDVKTGKRLGCYSQKTNATVADINQAGAWLGWAWWNDAVPNASFDEIRVWNAALSEGEMLAHVRKGPDEVFTDTPMPAAAEDNVYPENPSAELLANNYLAHRWTFNNTLRDAIGGKLASTKAASQLPGMLSCVGGGNGGSYIELGGNILPATGPVTLEIWCTPRALHQWAKQFLIGNGTGNYFVITYATSAANGPSSFGFNCSGYTSGNVEGAGTYPLNVPTCTTVTFTPKEGGKTRAEMRVWNAETGAMVGGVGSFEGNFSLANLVQSMARLNTATGYWGDQDEDSGYDEVRVWNAALSESQQRINVQLGPDRLPRLVPGALIGGECAELEVASGATVDLLGGEVTQYAVSGEGTVRNGTLVVDGVLSPGGNGTVGELTLEAGARVTGTIRLDVGDTLDCAGALDLSAATIEVVNPQALNGVWTLATSSADGITGHPASNLKGTGYRLSISAGAVKIIPEGVVLFIR